MATYRELTYMCLDQLKVVSEDSHFQKEHVIFLLDKFRTMLLKQRYSDIRKEIPESNYQTICIDLKETSAFDEDVCNNISYLKSEQKVPNMLTLETPKVSTTDYFQGNITYVNRERFKYVGNNKYLKNIIYSTIAPDEYLYLKSNNIQYKYLEKVKLTGIFEDSAKAASMQCPDEEGNVACDILDMNFPLEEGLISTLIELVVKELSGAVYKPKDTANDSSDDLDKLSSYLARNLKKNWERDGATE